MTHNLALLLFAILLAAPSIALAGTEPRSSAQTPFSQLYPSQAPPVGYSDLIQDEFLKAFFNLLPTLRERKLSLQAWFREDHIVYLSDYLSDDEKKRMIPLFQKIGERVKAGERDILKILGHSPLIEKVGEVAIEVLRFKDMHKTVIELAIKKHQKPYSPEQPYSYHLRRVREVLKQFGFGPKDSLLGLKLGTAAWLHDIIEDTDVTHAFLAERYGEEIADIVQCVTKFKIPELTKEENLRLTYERTRRLKASRILKLADRIANVEEGLTNFFGGNPSIVQKYFDEWPIFREMLYVKGEAEEMWTHLELLLTNQVYARSFAVNTLYKLSLEDCLDELELRQ